MKTISLLSLIVLGFVSCVDQDNKTVVEHIQTPAQPAIVKDSSIHYTITIKQGPLSDVPAKYKTACDSAFKLMEAIYNSAEFQDSIRQLNFRCDSYGGGCDSIVLNKNRITGTGVLNKLFQYPEIAWNIVLKKNGGPLGQTIPFSNKTNTYVNPILADMPEFSLAYGLAVNLCHEYTHQIGFKHIYCTGKIACPVKDRLSEPPGKPDPKFYNEDVTYRVGWVAYHILKRWKEKGAILKITKTLTITAK